MALPTQEQVDASAQSHIDRLMKYQREIEGALRDAAKVPGLPRSTEWKAARLAALRDKLVGIVAKESCCREGCSACCHMATAISTSEAKVISKHTGLPFNDVEFDLPDRSEQVKKYMGVPCPFLKDNRCSIYEVRPSACRANFNISDYPEICSITEAPGRTVPNLNMQALWYAEAAVALEKYDTVADIREFFPRT